MGHSQCDYSFFCCGVEFYFRAVEHSQRTMEVLILLSTVVFGLLCHHANCQLTVVGCRQLNYCSGHGMCISQGNIGTPVRPSRIAHKSTHFHTQSKIRPVPATMVGDRKRIYPLLNLLTAQLEFVLMDQHGVTFPRLALQTRATT